MNNQDYITGIDDLNKMLDLNRQNSHKEPWNKLDKGTRMKKLKEYAQHFGEEHKKTAKEVKQLYTFFVQCVEKNRLNRTKDVVYDRKTMKITDIPGLFFKTGSQTYTLKSLETNRVSALSSLTPRRTNKNKSALKIKEDIPTEVLDITSEET